MSLVLGVVSLGLSFLTGVPAIILGMMARKEIRASGGGQGGDGMAIAGIVLGWIGTLLVGLTVVLAAVVFVLVSDLSPEGTPSPEIALVASSDGDGVGGSVTVVRSSTDVLWSSLEETLDEARCDTPTSGLVQQGQSFRCASNGAYSLMHGPSGTTVASLRIG